MIRAKKTGILILSASLLYGLVPVQASAQLLHLWEFDGADLTDHAGSLDLSIAPGEGNVDGVFGMASDLVFEPGFNGVGHAYRPYYVDVTQSSTAGVGLTGSGFASPEQFTIEAIVRVDAKISSSAVNYIFQTRPGADRGYFLVQDEDNLDLGSVGGIGTIIGNNFGNVGLGGQYDSSDTWLYIAAVIDLSPAANAVADLYAANLSAGQMTPVLIQDDYMWDTSNPDSLTGTTGIFGIGDFAIDRNGDDVAEASQEWFEGAIDYLAIYNGLLTPEELQDNLTGRLERTPVADTPTTFSTSIVFTNGYPGSVMVTRTCNTGTPLQQEFEISEAVSVQFTSELLDFLAPGVECTITLSGLDDGYVGSFLANGIDTGDACVYSSEPEAGEAAFGPAPEQMNTCEITAEPVASTFQVEKVWEFEGNGIIDVSADIDIWCAPASSDTGPSYDTVELSVTAYEDDAFNLQFYPHWDGSTVCYAEESGLDSSVESDGGCLGGTGFVVGDDAKGCTITNTVFFEGIPTLNQWGLALMALLTLGVGLVGFRRFA